jgi:ribosomal protein S18 acetylase RimI-like enzyme
MIEYHFRQVKEQDSQILQQMLRFAIYGYPGYEPASTDMKHRTVLTYYLQDWGHEDDIGFIAVRNSDQKELGAAWIRRLAVLSPRPIFIATNLPELMIAVHPDYRGMGIGTDLLAHLLEKIKDRFRTIALSVEPQNPALRLYQRFGFEIVGVANNRLIMHLHLTRLNE